MSPINFSLYEELPEPVFLQLQRQQREKEQAEKLKNKEYFDNLIKNIHEKAEIRYKSEHEKKSVTDI